MSEEIKLYTDIEYFTREFSFIKNQYCMPYFKQNYKEEHKIYEQYETLINKMFKKLYDLEHENKQLKERIDKAIENCKKSIESINQKLQDDKTIKVVDGEVVNMNEYQIVRLKAIRMKCKELLEILGDKENE